jgi:hypothetical protein
MEPPAMPPFATTDGRCVLSRSEIAQYRLIHNSLNHPKVPETPTVPASRLLTVRAIISL